MNPSFKIMAPIVAALAISACSGGSSNMPSTAGGAQAASIINKLAPQWQRMHLAKAECAAVVGKPSCLALRVIRNGISPACSPSSSCGFTPLELESAYKLTKDLKNGSGTKVAVIEAGDLASASTDLSTYRSQFNLGTGNMTKYNENGQTSNFPPSCQNYGWCAETALDIDMVSASCPKCTILLMEANDGISDFETAEATAVSLGATVLSNSWICPQSWDCDDTNFPNYFDTKGVTYLASSGDNGYDQIGGPSVLTTVIAAGGTQLEGSGNSFTETAWADAGAGCANSTEVGSPGVPKPSWQTDPGCSNRTDADVSSESGCQPGVAEYISEYGGWITECGTSVASPFLAGVVAVKGNQTKINAGAGFWQLSKKKLKKGLHAITSGADGSCGGSYLCTAGTGQFGQYSGPTGWGTAKTDKVF